MMPSLPLPLLPVLLAALVPWTLLRSVTCFQAQSFCTPYRRRATAVSSLASQKAEVAIIDNEDDDDATSTQSPLLVDRRDAVVGFGLVTMTASLLFPATARAGIDVSGLRVEGGGSANGGGNAALQQQLRAIDGSGSARIQSLQQQQQQQQQQKQQSTPEAFTSGATSAPAADAAALSSAATYAYRYNVGVGPKLSKLGLAEERYRYQDALAMTSSSARGYLNVQFDFPSDWLQLDRVLGGIQYVDQRNGDKLYVLKAKLPEGESLISVPKQWFATSLFDAKGTIAASGVEVDEYKVSKSNVLNDGNGSTSPHRRLLIKYGTVTPNGLRTERRGLADAYEVDGVAYMLFTGSNAIKFDQNGPERETVEKIVNSFIVESIR